MKISCTTLACPGWPLERILDLLQSAGYDAIDFRGLDDQMEIWRLPAFSADLDATADRIARAGLAVSALSSGARMFVPDPAQVQAQVDEVAHYGRLCRALHAPIIRVFGGATGDTPMSDAIPAAAESLARLAEAAGPDVTVAVETHDDWVRSRPLAEVLARVDAENVGVLWDLHHPWRLAGEPPEETYANIGRHAVAVHVKDSRPAGKGKYEYCLPGEGDVPLAAMARLLRQGGYDGYLTLEWEKRWHPDIADAAVAVPAYGRYMRDHMS